MNTPAATPSRTAGSGGSVLAEILARETVRGELWRREKNRIRCLACGHRCLIAPGRSGVCRVRFNEGGELRVPFGYVSGVQCDPVEKKPFFHVLPGSEALTFGMLGCDFHCGYCQNWLTSQTLRDGAARSPITPATPGQLVEAALRHGARLMVSSYNEPLITAEWAVAVFRQAREAGLTCAFVSNGNATPEALDYLQPWISAYKIDLKGFNDQRYRSLGGTLANVCRGIEQVLERGIWLEVVTLIVPGFNDGEDELQAIAGFLAGCSRDIPWHVTAFHPDYKMTDRAQTRARQLRRAAEIGVAAGLKFVYAGNAPGRVDPWEDTRCPTCETVVVERSGYHVRSSCLSDSGHCRKCGARVPGIWTAGRARIGSVPEPEWRCRAPRRVMLGGERS